MKRPIVITHLWVGRIGRMSHLIVRMTPKTWIGLCGRRIPKGNVVTVGPQIGDGPICMGAYCRFCVTRGYFS